MAAKKHLDPNPLISVEDVTQEVILKLLHRLASISKPRSCAYQAARRLCFKLNVKNRKRLAATRRMQLEHEGRIQTPAHEPLNDIELIDRVLDLEKATAMTVLLKIALGESYVGLSELFDSVLGEKRSPSFYRLKVGSAISSIRDSYEVQHVASDE